MRNRSLSRATWSSHIAYEVASESQVLVGGERTRAACVVPDDPDDPGEPGEPGDPELRRLPVPVPHDSSCVFQSLTLRFAVYRGRQPSERDMSFEFRVSGGFVPLSASLLTVGGTTSVSPQSLEYVPQLAALAVADGAQKGLTFIALDNVGVSHMFY